MIALLRSYLCSPRKAQKQNTPVVLQKMKGSMDRNNIQYGARQATYIILPQTGSINTDKN